MNSLITGLLTDFTAEHNDLVTRLREQSEQSWAVPTPAPGWNVRDQIAHLAHFDSVTTLSIADPDRFLALRDSVTDLQTYVDGIGPRHADRYGNDVLAWWQDEHRSLCAAAAATDPSARVPWFGPSMSLASKLTARMMETWAHGQDVIDALGQQRTPTARLRHIARIGVLAFANSYRARGIDPPESTVHVDLTPPDGGEHWTWGAPAADDAVVGPAEDFCLVVTQRRHPADTTLEVHGRVAWQWMSIAQAFAGPPGEGRKPGQFAPQPATAPGTAS